MIPKKIHYCWLSNDPLPLLAQKCMDSWKNVLPEYEIILWDLNRFDISSVKWVKEAYDAKKYAFAADYIRLFALATEGGIYFDSDVEVLKNFDDLLNQNSFIGFESSGDIEAAVIGSIAGCKWIINCLSYYEGRSFMLGPSKFEITPLPIIIEKCLRSDNLMIDSHTLLDPVWGSHISFYPSDFFSPKNNITGTIKLSPRCRSIHHFDGQWVSKNFKFYIKKCAHYALEFIFGLRVKKVLVKIYRKIV
jgi:hypothetical protein